MNMSYKEIHSEMNEIRKTWRQNYFVLSQEEKERYDFLLAVRRERVNSFYRDNLVFKGSHQPAH